MKNQLRKLIKHSSNIPGWRTNRKIVVFESDDWGTIRMPSKSVQESLKKNGLDMSSVYNRFDSLASSKDLSDLFEVLNSVQDKNNKPAIFTPISLVANPDFQKIKESGFQSYYYEPFTDTLKRYNKEDAWEFWKQGLDQGFFVPEFHGREHINVQLWLRALQRKDKNTLIAFDHQMWDYGSDSKHGFLAAFDLEFPDDINYQKTVIEDGLKLFEKLHGYKAQLFVPPNGPFNSSLEETAFLNGIKYFSTPKIHKEPTGNGKYSTKLRWLGKKNKYNQYYLTRNAAFEPVHGRINWVDNCLSEIMMSFKWGKPAIISTHRVNYIGAIEPSNRENGLKLLKVLLDKILKKWPGVEFMSSIDLGALISGINKDVIKE